MIENTTIRSVWYEMYRRIMIAIPSTIIRVIDGGGKESYPFVIKAIPVVIVMLSVASISVINSRATAHHAGWNSPLVATGVAVLVPLATLAAALTRHRGWSAVFWVVSLFVAFVSGSIQYNVYTSPGATGIEALEAYAFGYGVPFAEVLFAIMEAVSINQWLAAQCDDAEKAEQLAIAKRRQQRQADIEAERQAEEDAERQRQVALEAKRQEALLEIEIEEKRMAIEEKRKDREAKRQSSLNKTSDSGSDSLNQKTGQKRELSRDIVLRFYRDNPLSSQREAAESTGLSQSTVNRVLRDSVNQGLVHRNGNGVEVLNG